MQTDELFINAKDLLSPLSANELNDLLFKSQNGNNEAKNKIIEHNIRLVLYEVNKKFSQINYDKKELVCIGIFGLIKAVETYKIEKHNQFSTYASKCIDNEILIFFRKLRKEINIDSLEKPIEVNNDEYNGQTLKDIITGNEDIADYYIEKEMQMFIEKQIQELPPIERRIIILYFGLYNNRRYNQEELGKMFGYSRSNVSIIIKKVIDKIRNELIEQNIIELPAQKQISLLTPSSKQKIRTRK